MHASRAQPLCLRLKFSARLLAAQRLVPRAPQALTVAAFLRKAAATRTVRHQFSLPALPCQASQVSLSFRRFKPSSTFTASPHEASLSSLAS